MVIDTSGDGSRDTGDARWTVAVTLAHGALAGLEAALSPAEVVRAPVLGFEPPRDRSRLDGWLRRLAESGTLVVTSPRGAAAVASRLASPEQTAGHPRVAWALGPASAAPLAAVLQSVQILPDDSRTGSALAQALIEAGVPDPIVLARGNRARPELARLLRQAKREVREVVVYRTVPRTLMDIGPLIDAHAVVVGSPMAATALARAGVTRRLVAIGPTTARAVERDGSELIGMARTPDVQGVAAAVIAAAGVIPARR